MTDRDFPGMLAVIQDQAWALWNDFLEPEFGFKEDHLQVTFSGHRGFHLHYRDPALFHLDSEARRELVSHIRGEGVDVQGGLARYHDQQAKGWTQRIREGMDAMIGTLRESTVAQTAALPNYGGWNQSSKPCKIEKGPHLSVLLRPFVALQN